MRRDALSLRGDALLRHRSAFSDAASEYDRRLNISDNFSQCRTSKQFSIYLSCALHLFMRTSNDNFIDKILEILKFEP